MVLNRDTVCAFLPQTLFQPPFLYLFQQDLGGQSFKILQLSMYFWRKQVFAFKNDFRQYLWRPRVLWEPLGAVEQIHFSLNALSRNHIRENISPPDSFLETRENKEKWGKYQYWVVGWRAGRYSSIRLKGAGKHVTFCRSAKSAEVRRRELDVQLGRIQRNGVSNLSCKREVQAAFEEAKDDPASSEDWVLQFSVRNKLDYLSQLY